MIFAIGIFTVLFLVIRPLRDANKVVMLFTRIRGEQLTFFVGHFQTLYDRITEDKEKIEKDDFYHVFQDLALRTRKEHDSDRMTYRTVTSSLRSPLVGWFLRFLILNSLVVFTLALKFYLTRVSIQALYNQFYFIKNNAFFDVHTNYALFAASAKVFTAHNNPRNPDITSLYKEDFYKALNRSKHLEPAVKMSSIMTVKSDLFSIEEKLTNEDLCVLLPQVADFCADPFIKKVLGQGIGTLQSVFNFGLQYTSNLFANASVYGSQLENVLSTILGVELYQLNLLSLPLANKKSAGPRVLLASPCESNHKIDV